MLFYIRGLNGCYSNKPKGDVESTRAFSEFGSDGNALMHLNDVYSKSL